MPNWTPVSYTYDGSFAGFLTCVFEAYLHREEPACFFAPEDSQVSLWPERPVVTHQAHAQRVYRSLSLRISPDAQALLRCGFLTCLEDRELHLWHFLRLGYAVGGRVMGMLTDSRVDAVRRAVLHLEHEAHQYKGFLRFSDQEGVLIAEIDPKNRVLPLLRPHFCTRFSAERFLIYDRTHREALFYQPRQWAILPLEDVQLSAPGETERRFRALWRRFYQTIAIEDRYNPKCRMTHMPKRYWSAMTEFQADTPPNTLP